jgi:hypothetical protein
MEIIGIPVMSVVIGSSQTVLCSQELVWLSGNHATMHPIWLMIGNSKVNNKSKVMFIYFRLVVEICKQHAWTFSPETVIKLAESFAIVTFGSAFFHGSETGLGGNQDVMSNNLLAYAIHQAAVETFPFDPIIHDLSYTPRGLNGKEIVNLWLDMFEEWSQESGIFNQMPSIQQGWAIPGSAHQYYTQYYTGQKLPSNTNTQYQYYTESQSTIQARHSSVSACLSD